MRGGGPPGKLIVDLRAAGGACGDTRPLPREYALTGLFEELLVHHYLPGLPWGSMDGMAAAERRTLIEFARYLQHREDLRDQVLLARHAT